MKTSDLSLSLYLSHSLKPQLLYSPTAFVLVEKVSRYIFSKPAAFA